MSAIVIDPQKLGKLDLAKLSFPRELQLPSKVALDMALTVRVRW
jgi:hypothetical protein